MTAHIRKMYRRAAAQPIVLLKSTELTPEKETTFLHISCKSWARLAAGGDDHIGAEARRWLAAKGLSW